MSQRIQKVSSLIQQVVAAELPNLPKSAHMTITKIDVTPDLRHATVWVGVVAAKAEQADAIFKNAEAARDTFQQAVAKGLKTKFVPRLVVKRDVGGAYADEITRLIRGL